MQDHTEVQNRTAPLVPRVQTPGDDSERTPTTALTGSVPDDAALHEEVFR